MSERFLVEFQFSVPLTVVPRLGSLGVARGLKWVIILLL